MSEIKDLLQDAAEEIQSHSDQISDEEQEVTVKNMQEAINEQHPFGLRLWKPALYKKNRSIDAAAYEAIHALPLLETKLYLSLGNILWLLLFGWWMCLLYVFTSLLIALISLFGRFLSLVYPTTLVDLWLYSKVLLQMSLYLLWPFGKFITKKRMPHLPTSKHQVAVDLDLDDDDSDDEHSLLLKKRFISNWTSIFNRESGLAGSIFFVIYFLLLAPVHLFVCTICYFLVVSVPMGRMNFILLKHLLKHPLRISSHVAADLNELNPEAEALLRAHERAKNFLQKRQQSKEEDKEKHVFRPYSIVFSETSEEPSSDRPGPSRYRPSDIFLDPAGAAAVQQDLHPPTKHIDDYIIVLCIRNACGWQYYKYTVDGINIIFFNFLGLVVYTLLDYFVIHSSNTTLTFVSALLSTVPLAYFIGMAVSSITAQTGSLGVGAVVNATFGSIVEVILYCLALMNGKERMVEGAIIGSFLCGLLALPGSAMLAAGLKTKEQRFNVKSAGVTGTLIIMAIIGAFTPTLFQQIYGEFVLRCKQCPVTPSFVEDPAILCRSCHYVQVHPTKDPIYQTRTKPLMYFCAGILVLTYAIGLWFTLRTHSKRIYVNNLDKVKEEKLKETIWSQIMKHQKLQQQQERFLHQGRKCKDEAKNVCFDSRTSSASRFTSPSSQPVGSSPKFSQHANTPRQRVRPYTVVGDMSAKAEASPPLYYGDDLSSIGSISMGEGSKPDMQGHDNPNWSTTKSVLVLLISTVAFSLIAEVLIGCLDPILKTSKLDEKFLGLTLFALIPTVTEFYNAIAFANQGNIVLALEIGSAYTIQVALLQIPALVGVSAVFYKPMETMTSFQSPFTLVFPRFDVYAVLLGTFILTFIYNEGKSNYFKGSMLLLAYFVMIVGFWYVPAGDFGDVI